MIPRDVNNPLVGFLRSFPADAEGYLSSFSPTISPMVKRKRALGVDRALGSGQRPANRSDAAVRTVPLVFPEVRIHSEFAHSSQLRSKTLP